MTMAREDENPFVPIHQLPRLRGATRSALGQQTLSSKQSMPIHSFGLQTNRGQAGKVFISSEHHSVEMKGKTAPLGVYQVPAALDKQLEAQKRTAPRFSFSQLDRMVTVTPSTKVPGPGTYTLPGAFGDQADSGKQTQPSMKLGHAERGAISKEFLSERMMTGMLGTLGPDPGTYGPASALGKQVLSSKRTGPAFSLSSTERLKAEYERLSQSMPAPGQYDTWLSIGRQPLSQFKTAPSTGFGKSSSWDGEKARFLSLSHARTLMGSASPGNFDHQTAQNMTTLGRQTLSSRTSPPRTSFGSSPKLVFKVSNTPGPGHYD